MKILHGFVLAAVISTVTCCSVQKRHYTRGLHVEWHHRQNQPAARQTVPERPESPSGLMAVALPGLQETDAVRLNPARSVLISIATPTQPVCDSVTMRDGKKFRAKVLEISPLEIKFRRCDVADSSIQTVKKSEVSAIRYANGMREAMPLPKSSDPPVYTQDRDNTRDTRRVHPAAKLSLATTIVGLSTLPLSLWFAIAGAVGIAYLIFLFSVLLFFVSLIAGVVAIASINARRDKWKGLSTASFGIVTAVLLLLYLLYMFVGPF